MNSFHARRLKLYLEEDHGGVVITGGRKVDVEACEVEPTVVLGPRPDSKMMTDEIFGPILPILEFKAIEEAVAFINAREKPLALYYFGRANKGLVLA